MMFSSSKPFGTNCNFLNSVSSSCQEHFESYYKYIYLNNFTFRGELLLQLSLITFSVKFFFLKNPWIRISGGSPHLFVKGMILFFNRKKTLPPTFIPQKTKSWEWRHLPLLQSGMSKGKRLWKCRLESGHEIYPRVPGKASSSTLMLSDQSCISVF